MLQNMVKLPNFAFYNLKVETIQAKKLFFSKYTVQTVKQIQKENSNVVLHGLKTGDVFAETEFSLISRHPCRTYIPFGFIDYMSQLG